MPEINQLCVLCCVFAFLSNTRGVAIRQVKSAHRVFLPAYLLTTASFNQRNFKHSCLLQEGA